MPVSLVAVFVVQKSFLVHTPLQRCQWQSDQPLLDRNGMCQLRVLHAVILQEIPFSCLYTTVSHFFQKYFFFKNKSQSLTFRSPFDCLQTRSSLPLLVAICLFFVCLEKGVSQGLCLFGKKESVQVFVCLEKGVSQGQKAFGSCAGKQTSRMD
jgi:hypothetical protein